MNQHLQDLFLKASENLEAVAQKIELGHMWCKGDWSEMLRIEPEDGEINPTFKRLGCAEGLMMEQMGFYESYTPLGDMVYETEHVKDLRQTWEWSILAQAIEAQNYEWLGTPDDFDDDETEGSYVTSWNDWDDLNEDECVRVFRVAAQDAKIRAGQ